MKKIIFLFFLITISQTVLAQEADSLKVLSDGTIIIDNFQNQKVGELPSGWYDRNATSEVVNESPKEQQKYKYRVLQEGSNKYLHYQGTKAMHLNFPLRNRKNLNIYKTPILSWRVRVDKIPENANEDDDNRNDSAASIYVVFDLGHILFKKVPKSIRYSWSSTLSKGTQLTKLFGNQKIIVVQSGTKETGKWVTFKRNIVEDYKRLFGDDPPKKPLAILILSDGDSTGNRSVADYDDIELRPAN